MKTCLACNKKMTLETDQCVFCGSDNLKSETSATGLIITFILISGICFVGYTIFQTVADKSTKIGLKAGQKITTLANSIQGIKNAITTIPNQQTESAQIYQPENKTIANYEEETQPIENVYNQEEQFTEENNETSEQETNPKLKERRAYWQKIYKEKYPAPLAGNKVYLKLKNGRVVSGLFMGVVNTAVRLEIDNEIKTINKNKLSTKSRCQMFSKDYVEYFVIKRLKEENLI